MAYITKERVAEVRKQLKSQFPDFKFSITRDNHSAIRVIILQAPFNMLMDLSRKYESVNYFCIADHYKEFPLMRDTLLKIYGIMNEGNGVASEDGDYGSIPNFYVTLSVGCWDKPFEVVERTPAKIKPVTESVQASGIPAKIEIVQYGEKAIAVIGETYPVRETLKGLGGRFNKFLKVGAGWIFPRTKEQEVKTAFSIQ